MSLALYRLYRPKTFDEVVGQNHITTVLKNELIEQRLSHAYLFVGSRGTGKTTCAKLLAKAVNCLDLQHGNPCGACQSCLAVESGAQLDVIEIDAASNNGVDDIRQLREEAVFTPSGSRYRVYIIDEVHMLSNSAFNALLKILEEPPKHVIFILATTEIHKVLPTIISRCQRFDFKKIAVADIQSRLLTVAQHQSLSLTEDAARLIAAISDGGMRDALSLLDVCCAYAQSIDATVVSAAAGLAGFDHLLRLCDAIISGDNDRMITALEQTLSGAIDPQRLCEQLTGHYRNLMLVKTLKAPQQAIFCSDDGLLALKQQAKALSLSQIMGALRCLQDSAFLMAKSQNKRTELEICLLTLTCAELQTDAAALLPRIEKLEAAVRKTVLSAAQSEAAPPAAAKPASLSVEKALPSEPPTAAAHTAPTPSAPVQAVLPPTPVVTDEDENDNALSPFAAWSEVLTEISKTNQALFGMMRQTTAFFDGRRVLIDIQNPVLLNMLKSNDYTKSAIKDAITLVTGKVIPIGPYRANSEAPKTDPLEKLIGTLEGDENVIIR